MGDNTVEWNREWRPRFEIFASQEMSQADPGHDFEHVKRVVTNAVRLAEASVANMEVILPAAWLHDCVSVPKSSPMRNRASRLAAERALEFLEEIDYPSELHPAIEHCIAAHSFSAGIPCETYEAKIVQDADRLEALGAIGLARCLMTGGSMGQRLYEPCEPFPIHRTANDGEQSLDHFFVKLLGLHRTMQTDNGRVEAVRRTLFLTAFLEQLAEELSLATDDLRMAINRYRSFPS